MDPNNQNPQGDNGAVKKLEQDLQNLSEQAATAEQPVPVSPPIQQPPPPETPTITPVPVVPPVTSTEENVTIQGNTKKGSPLMIIAIILALVAVLAVVAYVLGAKLLSPSPKPIACTSEAKICPDGSSVGRVGPNCEFATCPISTPTATPIENLLPTASPSASPTVAPVATPTIAPPPPPPPPTTP